MILSDETDADCHKELACLIKIKTLMGGLCRSTSSMVYIEISQGHKQGYKHG